MRISTVILAKVTLLVYLFTSGCSKIPTDEAVPAGHYINHTILEAARDTFPGALGGYCYEMDFYSPDSVRIYFGFEEGVFAFEKDNENYVIREASAAGDLEFSVEKDSSIVLRDGTWNASGIHSQFSQSKPFPGRKWNFPAALNSILLAGSYLLFEHNAATSQTVIFGPDGSVSGLPGYDRYQICFSGDCVSEVSPPTNNITLEGERSPRMYAFRVSQDRSVLELLHIAPPIADIKGERPVTTRAFDLRKKRD